MSELRKCMVSGKEFEISDDDIRFYDACDVPYPTLCPEERERRRLVWRNERHLYRQNCGLCMKSLIAIYPQDSPFPVYCKDCFFSEKWDPLSYGRDFDFDRPFFKQFSELSEVVPRLAITHANSVNSEYTLNSVKNRNCYLTSGADYNEDCLYGISTQRSKECVDTFLIYDSELSYGCLDSTRLYSCIGCQECENTGNSWFLYDCKDCKNCAFSSNLRDREYVLFNKQLKKSEYQRQLSSILAQLFENPDWLDESRRRVKEKAFHTASLVVGCDNVSGNYIRHCKNSFEVYDAEDLENCKYVYYGTDTKNAYDVSCVSFKCDNFYEVMSSCNGRNVKFCNASLYCHDLQYCLTCFNSGILFGSISINLGQNHVILNKQYSKEAYEDLMRQIINHMRATGEYGEYFPPWLSPFGYNESSAFDFMPLSKEDANELGYLWYDDEEIDVKESDSADPNCNICRCKYKIIGQELDFYNKLNLATPKLCWPCRLKRLIESRRPWKLFENHCKNCLIPISTTFAPDCLERVYCEKCYNQALHVQNMQMSGIGERV
ncbi:MAG: hypothetical protein O3B47_02640 [bacterium]|nr:hypothetical protein [bacterium]